MDIPEIRTYHHAFEYNEEEILLVLNVLKFENGYFTYIYDNKPKLGSISVAFQIEKQSDRYQLFSGNQGELADTIAIILSKKLNAMVYCSININHPELAKREKIKLVLDKFIDEIN